MCKHGTYKKVKVLIPARYAAEGVDVWKIKLIDSCIADIVEALQGKIKTIGSCCGHGESKGEILLLDGRKLVVDKNEYL